MGKAKPIPPMAAETSPALIVMMPKPNHVLTHASTVPTPIAIRPAGVFPGKRTPPYQPAKIIAKEMRPMIGASNISIAGRIEMNVIEIPARVPNKAALGVIFRTCGATKAPTKSTKPSMNTQANPAM